MAQPSFEYEVTQVAKDVYFMKLINHRGRWVSSNITVVINEEDVLVVDSGLLPSAGADAIAEIKKLTAKPVRYLVNTHWHGDHWQGNEAFAKAYPGLEIIATERACKSILTRGMIDAGIDGYAKTFKNRVAELEYLVKNGVYKDSTKPSSEKFIIIKNALPGYVKDAAEMSHLKPVVPTTAFTDKMILRRGSREIQLMYLGYGNTSGDAVIYLPKEKVMIAGDLIVYPSLFESGSFSREWLETYKKLRSFQFDYLIGGHGDLQKGYDYLDFIIALFEEIITEVNASISAGKILDETSKEVTYEKVAAELSKNSLFTSYIKNLDPSFISESIQRAYPLARQGKL